MSLSPKRLARLLELRERALVVVKNKGTFPSDGSSYRALSVEVGDLGISYRTRFQRLPSMTDRERHVMTSTGGTANMPYGLDIWWRRKKVMNVEWNEDGRLSVLSYRAGDWELQLLAANEP